MAHLEQVEFFERLSRLFQARFDASTRVLEVGSQDINGSVRRFFPKAETYLGVDLGMAKGVDLVVPGEFLELPDAWSDISISTECFEHAVTWPRILLNMVRITRPGGLVILTFAGLGRAAHGTIDSEVGSSPYTADYYRNLGPNDLAREVELGRYFSHHSFEVNSRVGDTYFWGIRSENSMSVEFLGLGERLARSQGQLVQAAGRISQLSTNVGNLRHEVGFLGAQLEGLTGELQKMREQADHDLESSQLNAKLLERVTIENGLLRRDLQSVVGSKSWKITEPLRKARSWLFKVFGR